MAVEEGMEGGVTPPKYTLGKLLVTEAWRKKIFYFKSSTYQLSLMLEILIYFFSTPVKTI
jgi:hypothetical protein